MQSERRPRGRGGPSKCVTGDSYTRQSLYAGEERVHSGAQEKEVAGLPRELARAGGGGGVGGGAGGTR